MPITLLENYIAVGGKKPDDRLLYGLKKAREEMIPAIKRLVEPGVPVIVDELNSVVLPRTLNDDAVYDHRDSNIANFVAWLNDEKREIDAPPTTIKHALLKKHFNYLVSTTHQNVNIKKDINKVSKKRLDGEQRMTRRACKARLLDPSMKIDFLLEGFSIRETFDRTFSLAARNSALKDIQCAYDSYSSAELRFALKNLEHLQGRITFYCKNKENKYEAIDIFDFFKQQSNDTKAAIQQWADQKIMENKMALNTWTNITRACLLREEKNEATQMATNLSSVSPPAAATAAAAVPPSPLPRKTVEVGIKRNRFFQQPPPAVRSLLTIDQRIAILDEEPSYKRSRRIS